MKPSSACSSGVNRPHTAKLLYYLQNSSCNSAALPLLCYNEINKKVGACIMAGFSYEITERIAVLSTATTGWERQLNMISWNGREPKYDIRDWSPDGSKMGKGISLTAEELQTLKGILEELDLGEMGDPDFPEM